MQPSEVDHRTAAKAVVVIIIIIINIIISPAFSGKVKVDKEMCNTERKLRETKRSKLEGQE